MTVYTPRGSTRLAWLWALPIVTIMGILVPTNRLAVIGVVGAAAVAVLFALGRRTTRLFLVSLALLLTGYAFAGRGFAYIGVEPLFVGEVVLGLGVAAVMIARPTRRLSRMHGLIVAFMAWGALRTLPYIPDYGHEAPRDGAVWGYAIFAIAVSLLITDRHVRGLVRLYGAVVPAFVVWVPVFVIIWHAFPRILPLVPGTSVAIPFFKPGDMAVHLAGAAAFLLAGIIPLRGWRLLAQPALWAMWIVGFGAVSALNRGGMVALGSVTAIVLFVRAPGRWATAFLVGVLIAAIIGLTNPAVEVGRREVSAAQLVENVESIFSDSEDEALDGTREWRESWWTSIVDYTVTGPFFWLGKGFGINLAQDDGVQAPDRSLRAPHNAHMNILARSGVPGLTLWVAIQVAFAVSVIRAAWQAARMRLRRWAGILGWIFVYWLAALINMTFDVYLEGPQGGILYWSLLGLGIAVASMVNERVAARELAGRLDVTELGDPHADRADSAG
jgi:hypothetical protein